MNQRSRTLDILYFNQQASIQQNGTLIFILQQAIIKHIDFTSVGQYQTGQNPRFYIHQQAIIQRSRTIDLPYLGSKWKDASNTTKTRERLSQRCAIPNGAKRRILETKSEPWICFLHIRSSFSTFYPGKYDKSKFVQPIPNTWHHNFQLTTSRITKLTFIRFENRCHINNRHFLSRIDGRITCRRQGYLARGILFEQIKWRTLSGQRGMAMQKGRKHL